MSVQTEALQPQYFRDAKKRLATIATKKSRVRTCSLLLMNSTYYVDIMEKTLIGTRLPKDDQVIVSEMVRLWESPLPTLATPTNLVTASATIAMQAIQGAAPLLAQLTLEFFREGA